MNSIKSICSLVWLVFLVLILTSPTTYAWKIKNNTSYKFKVVAFGDDVLGNTVRFEKILNPGKEWFCDHDLLTGDGRCYRAGTGYIDSAVKFNIDVSVSGGRTFTCEMTMDRAGKANVYQQSRADLGIFPNLYCKSFHQATDKDGNLILQDETNTYGLNFTHRDVRFLASGDPQMDNGKAYSHGSAARTQTHMWSETMSNPQIRGIIVAGDLTNGTRWVDEFFWYRFGTYETIDGKRVGGRRGGDEPEFFEGLGNHDIVVPDLGRAAACNIGHLSCINPKAIRNFVRNKHRTTVTTKQGGWTTRPRTPYDYAWPNNVTTESCFFMPDLSERCNVATPHYSWDWHDVHFVMLNNYVGAGGDGRTDTAFTEREHTEGDPSTYTYWYHDHLESLAFLEQDLEQNVKDSNRPVVLIHHYAPGHEIWEDWQLSAYWNAIADYNVVAIIHGHFVHLEGKSKPHSGTPGPQINNLAWHNPWWRPYPDVGFEVGPDHIDVFNASASVNQAYLDVQIDDEKMTLQRVGLDLAIDPENNVCKLLCPSDGPSLKGIPHDVTVECDAVPALPPIESISATTACGTSYGKNISGDGGYAFHEVEIVFEGSKRIDGLCEDEYTLERTWSAKDTCGNKSNATQTIKVVDTKAPGIITDSGNRMCLSPPNHKMVDFGGIRDKVAVIDNCDPAPVVNSVECASNQCDDARCDNFPDLNGDGHTTQDCRYDWTSDILSVRSERSAKGSDRIYSVSYTGLDRCGNESDTVVGMEIDVKKRPSKEDTCIAP